MRTRLSLTLAFILVGAFAAQQVHAQTLNFTFTFTNNTGNVPGTVTGEIFGLENNAISAPTYITITSAPAGLGIATPDPTQFLFSQGDFTVTNGVITDDNFDGSVYGGPPPPSFDFDPTVNSLSNGTLAVTQTQGSFDPTVFSPASVPEPSTFGLLVAGAAVLIAWKRFSARPLLKV